MSKLTPSRRLFLGGIAATGVVGCKSRAEAERRPLSDDTAQPDTGSEPHDTGSMQAATRTPNILYIFSDQHRGDAWSKGGTPAVLTPTLDAIAAEGVSFTQMFTNGPTCRPARYTMMTGRHVHEHGVWSNLEIGASTIANHVRDMRDAGYQTAVIGKTHLHDDATHTAETVHILEEFGFEFVHELVGQNEQTWHETPYSDWLTLTTPAGEADKYVRYNNYANAYSWFVPPPDAEPWNLQTIDHLDWYCGMQAHDWILARKDSRPFYLQLNFPGPHQPFDSTSEFREMYEASALAPSILPMPVEPVSRLVQTLLEWKVEAFTAEETQELKLTYYAKISLVDAALAMVIDALKKTGELDNTWIIYSSDHGELLGDHQLTGKIAFYEGAIRVPLIIRPPGGIAPWSSEAMCDHLDVTATIRDLGGLDNSELPGVSLLPKVLAGVKDPDSQLGKTEIISENQSNSMIRSKDYKLTYDASRQKIEELYDLAADPEELTNLVNDPGHQSIVQDLFAKLLASGSPQAL